MRSALAVLIAALLVGAAGCSGSADERDAPAEGWTPYAPLTATVERQPSPSRAGPAPATPAAKRAISDWYEDGEFNGRYSCQTIEIAIAAFPISLTRYNDVVAAFRSFKRTVC